MDSFIVAEFYIVTASMGVNLNLDQSLLNPPVVTNEPQAKKGKMYVLANNLYINP